MADMQRVRSVPHGTDKFGAGRRRKTRVPDCEQFQHSPERSVHRSRAPSVGYSEDESIRVPRRRHDAPHQSVGYSEDDSTRVPRRRHNANHQSVGYSEDDSTRVPRRRHSLQHPSEHSMRRSREPLHRGDSRDDLDGCSEDDLTRVPRQEQGWHSSARGTHRSRVPVHRGDSRDDFDDYYEDDSNQVPRRKQHLHSSKHSMRRSRAPFQCNDSRDYVDGYSEASFGEAPLDAAQPARRRRADEAQHLDATMDSEDLSSRRDKKKYGHGRRSSRGSYCQEDTWAGETGELQAQEESRVAGDAPRVATNETQTNDHESDTGHHVRRKRRRSAISPAAVEHVDKNETPLDDLLEGLDKALKHAEDVCAGKTDQIQRHDDTSIERPRRRRRTAQIDTAELDKDSKADCVSRSPSPSMRTDAPPEPKPLIPVVKEDTALAVVKKPVFDLEALQQEKQKLLSAMCVRKEPVNERRNGFSSEIQVASAQGPAGSTERPKNPLAGMTGAAMARMRLINRPAAVPASRVAGISPMGYPMRPGVPLCTFYSQTGTCSYGKDCKWDHPTPATPALTTQGGALALLAYAPRSYDSKTEILLDEWVKCKRMRNFSGADAIRGQLRSQGVDPDVARPG